MERSKNYECNKTKVRNLLESGERISVGSVWKVIKTSELRHYLSQLRKEGMIILSEWVQRNDNRFKEYWIAKEVENA